MNELPWTERVAMFSIYPDAGRREDVARLAAELMEVKAHAKQLETCLINLGQDAHMGDCWAALHDFKSGFECDCGVSAALSILEKQR